MLLRLAQGNLDGWWFRIRVLALLVVVNDGLNTVAQKLADDVLQVA
jgi:hypothetical protein